ncbi:DUF523 domain-containing protein [Reinekea forsetii]|nr:DUF523 domain-containing protein [Reinekea forsetii]
MPQDKILVSACLLGNPVRYNGKSLTLQSDILLRWQQQGRVVSVCPEVGGGMSTPRQPAEIKHGSGEDVWQRKAIVVNNDGEEVTSAFKTGAQLALRLCQQHHIKVAVLTEDSPSCGSQMIYDGTFTSQKTAGKGVTAALLEQHGVLVFNQFNLEQAEHALTLMDTV